MIFRHEFIQLIHLRENGFDTLHYNKRGKKYVPDIREDACQECGFSLKEITHSICDSVYMEQVLQKNIKFVLCLDINIT